MKQVLIDTNFIITCVKQKIDFFNELFLMGFEIIIPEEVIQELANISKSGKRLIDRGNAKISLEILENEKFKKIKLNSKNVDKGIIHLSKKDKSLIIATLDKEIKDNVQNKKIVIMNKKVLRII